MGLLRLYLAISVVVSHLWGVALPWTINGAVSVIMFFMISGFYMSMVLNTTYARMPLGKFYLSRALRLYPVYFVALAIKVIFIISIARPIELPTSADGWALYVTSNLSMFGLNEIYSKWRLIPPAWSLSVELIFYAFAPFIARKHIGFLVLLFVALLAYRFSYLDEDYLLSRYRSTGPDLCFFLMGMLSHRLWAASQMKVNRLHIGAAIVYLIFLMNIVDLSTLADIDRPQNWVFYLSFAFCVPIIFSATKSSEKDRFIGDLSYPVYITHWNVMGIAGHFSGTILLFISNSTYLTLCAIATIVFGLVVHMVVDRPIERMRRRLKQNETAEVVPVRNPSLA